MKKRYLIYQHREIGTSTELRLILNQPDEGFESEAAAEVHFNRIADNDKGDHFYKKDNKRFLILPSFIK